MAERIAPFVVALCFGILGTADAADQPVTGVLFQLRDPKPGLVATQRTMSGHGSDASPPVAIAGNPTQSGGGVTVFVEGGAWTSQTFTLPQGVDAATGKPFWRAVRSGFVYTDGHGANGPVRSARIRLSGGALDVKVVAVGRLGPIDLLPPAPGTAACVRLDVGGGDSYHVLLPAPPASTISKNDARRFVIRNATARGLCPASTTTTTSTTSSTSFTTIVTTSTTTSTNPSSVCGNGIREPGEQCDGGPTCTADCLQTIPSCCSKPDQCISAPLFSLNFYLYQYCLAFLPGSSEIGGGLCAADGSCAPVAIDPVPVCCQLQNGSCYELTESSTDGLWHFQNVCRGSQDGTYYVAATCGPAGSCLPQ